MDGKELISSVESLLSVPFQFIFPVDNRSKIFSVNEAKELLDVHLVSCEMDCLLQMILSLLRQRCKCKKLIQRLVSVCVNNSMWTRDEEQQQQPEEEVELPSTVELGSTMDIPVSIACRSIVPILNTHVNYYCQGQYEYIHQQLASCLHKLSRSSQRIFTFYEQNEAYVDQLQLANTTNNYDGPGSEDAIHLDDADATDNRKNRFTSPVHSLLQQKYMAAEILHVIHNRIKRLCAMDSRDSIISSFLACGHEHLSMDRNCGEKSITEQQQRQIIITTEDTTTTNSHESNSLKSMETICQSLQLKYLNRNDSIMEHEMKPNNISTTTLQSLAEANGKSTCHNNKNTNTGPNDDKDNNCKRKRSNCGICIAAQTQMKRWKGMIMTEGNIRNISGIQERQPQQGSPENSTDPQMNAATVLAHFHTMNT